MAGRARGRARVPETGTTVRNHENQIKQGEVVDHAEVSKNPTSPASESAGSGREQAVKQ
jgi:hypothetical protein